MRCLPYVEDMTINIREVTFPDNILVDTWYTGTNEVHHLIFESCTFTKVTSILSNPACLVLKSLTFRQMQINIFNCDSIAMQFSHLKVISFEQSFVHIFKNVFLQSIASNLISFVIDVLSNNMTITSMFRNNSWNKLTNLTARANPYYIASKLSAENISMFQNLQYLDLSKCMITDIDENTFDAISSTLILLNLTDNRIQSLRSGVFNRIIGRNSSLEFKVDLTRNNFDCNCNLVELSAVSVWHNKFLNSSVFSAPVVCSNDINYQKPTTTWTGVSDCNNVHAIHTENVCLDFNAKYVYPIFSIKFYEHNNDGIIRIKSGVNETYRLWLRRLTDAANSNDKWSDIKCGQNRYSTVFNKCILVSGKITTFSIDELMEGSNMTFVCIHYVFGGLIKKFWPLHCATLIDHVRGKWNLTFFIIGIVSMVYILGFLIGIMVPMLPNWCNFLPFKTPDATVYDKTGIK